MMTSASGAALGHGVRGLSDQPQDFRQLLHHGGEADDRQLLDRKQRLEPLARHGAAADAFELHAVAKALAQHLHQRRAEPVAGFLRRDQEDLPDGIACLHHAARPTTKRYLASASVIIACGSAAISVARDDGDTGKAGFRDALDRARADCRQVEAQILAALRRLHQHAAPRRRADAALFA